MGCLIPNPSQPNHDATIAIHDIQTRDPCFRSLHRRQRAHLGTSWRSDSCLEHTCRNICEAVRQRPHERRSIFLVSQKYLNPKKDSSRAQNTMLMKNPMSSLSVALLSRINMIPQ